MLSILVWHSCVDICSCALCIEVFYLMCRQNEQRGVNILLEKSLCKCASNLNRYQSVFCVFYQQIKQSNNLGYPKTHLLLH